VEEWARTESPSFNCQDNHDYIVWFTRPKGRQRATKREHRDRQREKEKTRPPNRRRHIRERRINLDIGKEIRGPILVAVLLESPRHFEQSILVNRTGGPLAQSGKGWRPSHSFGDRVLRCLGRQCSIRMRPVKWQYHELSSLQGAKDLRRGWPPT
jgi:hypothetical protein